MKKSLILVLSLTIKLGFSQITSSLQACYPLNGNAVNGAPTGAVLNGGVSNVTSAVGLAGPGTAMQFAGNATSYIQLPGTPPLLKPNVISVSGWYNSDDLGQAYLVYTKNNCGSNFEAYALNFLAPGSLGIGTGGFYVSKAAGPSCSRVQLFQNTMNHPIPAIGAWTHVVFCIDNSNISLYINGTLNGSITHSIPWDYAVSPSKDVILGNTMESFTQSFKGRMDNLRFYNRCLSAAEVHLLYTRNPACNAQDKDAETVGLASYSLGSEILSQNSPNPFTNETTISYSIPASVTNASIEVYDMVGRKVATYSISNESESSLKITSSELSAGMYIYSIIGDGKVMESKRMIMTN